MQNFTGPILIVSPPRSRADLLARMVRAGGIPCADADGMITKLSTLGDGSPVWQYAIAGNLRAAAGADPGCETFAVVDRLSGHLGWESARSQWSWLLDVVPSLTIIFLTRNHIKTLVSLEHAWKVWVPRYGPCSSGCELNLASHLESIERFAELRPDRCIRLDSDDLLSFTKKPEWISEDAWTREITIRTHEVDSLIAPPVDPDWEGWENVPPARMVREERAANRSPAKAVEPRKQYMPEVDSSALVVGSLEVHTLRFGNPDWIDQCGAALEGWCDRHGYALKVHDADEGLPDEKFGTVAMIREFLAGGAEKMLFVDSDVFAHPQGPPFPDIPGFAVRAESSVKVLKHWARWRGGEAQGWKYLNSGVWSCDRESARFFLKETERSDDWETGCRERHQFNLWWCAAVKNGMILSELPVEWNRPSRVQKGDMAAAWFFHLNGAEKLKTLRVLRAERLLPPLPHRFDTPERTGIERAICYPWVEGLAAWEELRYSLRSVEKNFTDKECPIFILGPDRPEWLGDHPRVKHIFIDYSGGRHRGLYSAFRIGMTIAEKVLWMNDDEIFVKPAGWEDFAVALTEGDLHGKVESLLAHGNRWRAGMANSVIDLRHHGHEGPVMRFATHTPMLFERDKSIEIFERFHLPFKGGWANLYHNWHRTPHKPIGKIKTHSLTPRHVRPETLFLNYRDNTLTATLKSQIEEAFPIRPDWETNAPKSSALPYFGKGAVVWPWTSDEAEHDELWFSVQSVKKHFSEKAWVHVLFGDVKPDWWEGEFVHAPRYEDALYTGAQCADQVIWMNDDIVMLADQGPEDFAVARIGGKKSKNALAESENTWERQLGGTMMLLEEKGVKSTNFETHIPYLFAREKVQAAFEIFPPRQHKTPFATIYHNLHATPSRPLTEKARNIDDMIGKLWMNPQSREITQELIEKLETLFGTPPR